MARQLQPHQIFSVQRRKTIKYSCTMQSIPIVATPTESIIMPNDSEYQMYILANYWRHVT